MSSSIFVCTSVPLSSPLVPDITSGSTPAPLPASTVTASTLFPSLWSAVCSKARHWMHEKQWCHRCLWQSGSSCALGRDKQVDGAGWHTCRFCNANWNEHRNIGNWCAQPYICNVTFSNNIVSIRPLAYPRMSYVKRTAQISQYLLFYG